MVFPFPMLLATMQTLFSVVCIMGARSFDLIRFPDISHNVVWEWKWIGMVFVMPLAFNMMAVKYMSVESVMVFRAISTVFVACGDCVCLGSRITTRQGIGCAIVTFGGLLYACNDMQFSVAAYIWGVMYSISIIVNNIYIKYAFNKIPEKTNWEKTTYNNLLATPMLLTLSLLYEDHGRGWNAVFFFFVAGCCHRRILLFGRIR